MEQATNDYWGKYGADYEANQELAVGRDLLNEMAGNVRNLESLGRTLELGCGTGYFTEFLKEKTSELTATDYSPELLKITEKRFENDKSITVQQEDCMALSQPDGLYDTVFMANLIHVISEPAKAVRESARVLKKGGRLIIISFTNSGMSILETIKLGLRFMKAWGKPPKHAKSLSLKKLAKLLTENGFEVSEERLIGSRTKAVYISGIKK